MLCKKYYTLADSKITKQFTKLSSLNLNLPSYKIKYGKKHQIEFNNEINKDIHDEINKINHLIYELKNKIHDDIHFILVMKNYQDANTFQTLTKHEYPIIQMDLDDILKYCEYTKNNILIANNINSNMDKIMISAKFLYVDNKI